MENNFKPGRKDDKGKSRMDLVDPNWMLSVGDILAFGAEKYEANSWQRVENARERYTAAAYRHLMAFHDGEVFDPESGQPHLSHASCCLMFLYWLTRGDRKIEEDAKAAKDELSKIAGDALIDIEHDWFKYRPTFLSTKPEMLGNYDDGDR